MAKTKTTTAGAFDVRNIIGALMGIYGIILLIMGMVTYGPMEAAKTGDVNANLLVGGVLFALGVFFLLWAKFRPQVVEISLEEARAAKEKESLADAVADDPLATIDALS